VSDGRCSLVNTVIWFLCQKSTATECTAHSRTGMPSRLSEDDVRQSVEQLLLAATTGPPRRAPAEVFRANKQQSEVLIAVVNVSPSR